MSDRGMGDGGADPHPPELYRTLVEDSNDVATIIDSDGRMTYVSPAVRRVLGFDPEELIGEVGFEYQHPDDREAVAEKMAALRADPDEPQTVEVRFERADGSWCWIESTMRNRLDDDAVRGFLVNSRDITARKERERRRKKLAEEYNALLENSDDAIFLLDADSSGDDVEFRFSRLSPGYVAQTGLTTDEVRDKTPREVFGDERGAELETNYRRCVEAGGPISYQEELSLAEGARFWQTSIAPVVVEGTVVRVVGIARNITERVEREQEIRRKNDRLDEFASVISHDVRNPLNVAQGRTALLREESESEHLEPLANSLDRIESIIGDTLILAREGNTVGEQSAFGLTDLVTHCWEMVDAGDATLEIEDELSIRGDRNRLQHVFENLLRNAVEHGGAGVTVTVGRAGTDGFSVADDGPGIPAEERDTIFGPGQKLSSGGTGFGLTIVKRIAEAHGWQVAVTEGRQGGARFEFSGVELV
jgi:PAS domain S-box-containing protein